MLSISSLAWVTRSQLKDPSEDINKWLVTKYFKYFLSVHNFVKRLHKTDIVWREILPNFHQKQTPAPPTQWHSFQPRETCFGGIWSASEEGLWLQNAECHERLWDVRSCWVLPIRSLSHYVTRVTMSGTWCRLSIWRWGTCLPTHTPDNGPISFLQS